MYYIVLMYETNITRLTDGQRLLFAAICGFSKRDNKRMVVLPEEKVREAAEGRDVIQLFLSLRYKKNISILNTSDINIFEEITTIFETSEISFKLTDSFYEVLRITPYDELEEYMSLTGKYAHNLYKLLTRMRKAGYKSYTIEEFRVLMNVPKEYNVSEMTRVVVRPAVRKLRRISGFENLDYNYLSKRKKAEKIIFEWGTE